MQESDKRTPMINLIASAPSREALAVCLEQAIRIIRAGSDAMVFTTRYASGAEFTLEVTGRHAAAPAPKTKSKRVMVMAPGGWSRFWDDHGGQTWSIDDLAKAIGCPHRSAATALSAAVVRGRARWIQKGVYYILQKDEVRA